MSDPVFPKRRPTRRPRKTAAVGSMVAPGPRQVRNGIRRRKGSKAGRYTG